MVSKSEMLVIFGGTVECTASTSRQDSQQLVSICSDTQFTVSPQEFSLSLSSPATTSDSTVLETKTWNVGLSEGSEMAALGWAKSFMMCLVGQDSQSG